MSTTSDLKAHQVDALRRLAANPAAFVEAGTLALLRRRMLVGREVLTFTRGGKVHEKTTSPVTPAGAARLAT